VLSYTRLLYFDNFEIVFDIMFEYTLKKEKQNPYVEHNKKDTICC